MAKRTFASQFEIMLDYFEKYPQILSGKVDRIFSKATNVLTGIPPLHIVARAIYLKFQIWVMRSREAQLLLNINKIDKFIRTSSKIPPEKKIIELTGKINDNTYDVYKDGSRINNETGFAVCIFNNNEPHKNFLYKLNPTKSVFQAKLAAIGFAATSPVYYAGIINSEVFSVQRIIGNTQVYYVTSFDKLNLSQFDWLEIEEFEMQLIDFQSSSTWIQKVIETRKELELIETERLTSNISKNGNNKILEKWNSLPDTLNCLKRLARAILTIFSSTYACESLFSEMNNIKDSLRNRLTDDSSSACILLKVTCYNPNVGYLSSNLQQQKSH
ncbi:hypothetical protein AVEN_130617-1 [Araneus ventricosus]|uniref:HAT C-terminal dimerisation domain-containing protein n=1 Tax=Araneus ventricosus TaxID=182803 RepID=A0A4Y2BQQ4_ARAVE|nr:hypothetical protein AVEN_130617-1 [Araneus ventricosus]